MPAACSGEFSTLAPTIGGCPADTELLFFCNVAGQQGGYAFRPWGTVKACLLTGLKIGFLQFKVGAPGSPMVAGQDTLIVNQNNIIQDSVFITLGGPELPRDDTTSISYGVTYNPSAPTPNFTVIFDQAVQNSQEYIVHYAYVQ